MGKQNTINVEWLREHYPTMTSIYRLLDEYEATFGWRPSKTAMYGRATKAGIKKLPVEIVGVRCSRPVRWSEEPEMEAWMLEHDVGQRMDLLSAQFCENFGFELSRGQISQFRARYGRQTKKGVSGRRPVPVGTERFTKDNYIMVKVAERPSKAMSKDNWKMKHVWVWEQTHGPVPDGCCVFFADGNKYNFDPDNLVAVPRKLVGAMNTLKSEGMVWHDAESLKAVMTMAEIRIERNKALAMEPKTCKCCGRPFTDMERYKTGLPVGASVCIDCGRAYRRPRKFDYDEIRRLSAQGLSDREVAERVGCAQKVVYRVVREEK